MPLNLTMVVCDWKLNLFNLILSDMSVCAARTVFIKTEHVKLFMLHTVIPVNVL